MKKSGYVLLFLVVASAGLLAIVRSFGTETVPYTPSDSCVSCHTDAEMLASEYTPEDPGGGGG